MWAIVKTKNCRKFCPGTSRGGGGGARGNPGFAGALEKFVIVVFASALFRTVALWSIVMGKHRKRHKSERERYALVLIVWCGQKVYSIGIVDR